MLELDKVIDLELELLTSCNADCPLCYRNYKSFRDHYPSKKQRDLFDIIKQLNEYTDLKWIRSAGSISEPTLYKDFIPLIEYIKRRNINVEICTIGDTRKDEFWKELSELLDENHKVYFTIC